MGMHSFSQRGIGTNTPAKSSILELSSTSKGFLVPRMTILNRAAIQNPEEGLWVYCKDCVPKGFTIFSDGKWSTPFGTIPTITAEQSTEIETNTTNNKGTVTFHSDIDHEGSGKIITDAERVSIEHMQDMIDKMNQLLILEEFNNPIKSYLEIGDYYRGGLVFYIADSPEDLNGDGLLDRGLVCSVDDLNDGEQLKWHNNDNIITGATGKALGSGKINTDKIIEAQGGVISDYAAGLASEYTYDGYDDWFLPSLKELEEMQENRTKINKTIKEGNLGPTLKLWAWSSSEHSDKRAYRLDLKDGGNLTPLKSNENTVRAIRVF
jgi:hypothetical protein